MKLRPLSIALSMIDTPSSCRVRPPNIIAPRQSSETLTPVRPRVRYFMGCAAFLLPLEIIRRAPGPYLKPALQGLRVFDELVQRRAPAVVEAEVGVAVPSGFVAVQDSR